jgi:hypothetical protein
LNTKTISLESSVDLIEALTRHDLTRCGAAFIHRGEHPDLGAIVVVQSDDAATVITGTR